MIRVAIVGGGISGLSAAFYLDKARRAGAQINYTVFERASRAGGVIQTETSHGFVIEAGPDSFLTAKPWAAELAKELGLDDQIFGSNDATRKTYILLRGRLVPMPDGLQMMVPTKILPIATSQLFSWQAKMRMARDYISPPKPLAAGEDESVASFVTRHLGAEVTEKLAIPLLAGVYGGNASRLSVRAVLPRFVEMEEESRSLVRGVLRAKKKSGGVAQAPLFSSFNLGMQQLVDALIGRLVGAAVRTGVAVQRIEKVGAASLSTWRVTMADGSREIFDHIIVATPAYVAAELLGTVDAQLGKLLGEIQYASSITVAVAYAAGARVPRGFGFLVPRSEGIPIVAATFVQNKFKHRVPAGSTLLRLFLTEAIDWTDEKIGGVVMEKVASILRITAKPTEMRIFRWARSMPQYEVGHLDRIAAIDKLVAKHVGLELIGSAYRGIGVPDCVREGKEAAGRVMKSFLAH